MADGFRDGKSDEDYLITGIFKDVKILDLEEEIVQYRDMGKKLTLKINKDPEYWEEGYVLLKYVSGGSDTLPIHAQRINCSKLNGFVSSHRFKESVLDMRKKESLDNNFLYTVHVFPIVVYRLISTMRIPLNVIFGHYKQKNGLEDLVFGHLKNW